MKILREPISALTHLFAAVLALLASLLMLSKQLQALRIQPLLLLSTMLFSASLILLYLTSGVYHSVSAKYPKLILRLRKLDHAMIYILIAGSYSPFCLFVLPKNLGYPCFIFLWILALAGIMLSIFWIRMPRKLSTLIYIVMGWTAIFLIRSLYLNLSPPAFFYLVLGGILYTIGGIIYALKKPNILHWNFHDIFHVFTMLGSLCHVIVVYRYLI